MPTPRAQVRAAIVKVVEAVLKDSGRAVPEVSDDALLTGHLKLDSLDLAVTVVGLEQQLGVDPFRSGAGNVRTFGDLVDTYEQALQGPS